MTLPSDFILELRKVFRGDIRLDNATRTLYSTDASIYQIEPMGVVIPRTQEDLIAVVELAAKYKIPVLPRGSGSSLAGQAIGHALILDCSRYLDHMPLEIDGESYTATVEPGVILSSLNREAAKYGLMFGPDPASAERATMGGVVGNNATGAHSILYGMTADNIISADVILSDGSLAEWGPVTNDAKGAANRHSGVLAAARMIREKYAEPIINRWPSTWRNSAGYRLNYLIPWSATRPQLWAGEDYPPSGERTAFNLATLLAGSEGTLAIIRSMKVRLVPKPKHSILGVLSYKGIAEACDAVPKLLKFEPSAVELIPQMLIRLARSVPAYAGMLGFVQGDPDAILVVEFSGNDISNLRDKVRHLGPEAVIAESSQDQAKIWTVRKVGLGIFDSSPAAARPVAFMEDCAIPVEHLGDFVREVGRILSEHNTFAAIYAHASAGCLHIRPILDLKKGSGVRNLRSIAEQVLALTLRLGGSMSSEHGDGLVRSEWLYQTYGPQVLEAMRALKKAADPDNILNPGKLFGAPVMDANLRYGINYTSSTWSSELDFSRAGGLAVAIEQCNGQGVCRKFDGVMCPSFQATRDEMHSTRGRSNLLRTLISVGDSRLTDEQVKVALDLCLACKGCKSECPSKVDMAKLKYEFQHHYYNTYSRPLRDYFFAYINEVAKAVMPFRRLINWSAHQKLVRMALKTLLGISDKRLLPHFGTLNWSEPKAGNHPHFEEGKKEVSETCLLLPDTFTHFFEPDIEKAALSVLSACGLEVKILQVFGAGRTLLSKGFIEPARHHAQKLLDEIGKTDPQGQMQVIGLEPSEIYTLRDELLDLLPERKDEIEALSARAWMIDEYLIRPGIKQDRLRIDELERDLSEGTKSKVLLHGHCYQKAQPPHPDGLAIGVNASAELLRAVGYEVEVLDTGCCGMAGAFGYEDDHYELSMQIGNMKLFPQIRAGFEKGAASVAAVGTSCRSQIADGTGKLANHSIVLVVKKVTR